MALTINTNLSSLIVQQNLASATKLLNQAIERMSTGYKINRASDNAAGYSIASKWETDLSSLDVASDNAATGADLLTTAEGNYNLISEHLQRIRDLTEQAANGTYGSSSLKAIQIEISTRLDEITRIAKNSEFNGILLMSYTGDNSSSTGITKRGIDLQVGLYSDANSIINLEVDLFRSATVTGLFSGLSDTTNVNGTTLSDILKQANNDQEITISDEKTSEDLKTLNNVIAAAATGLVYDSENDTYTPASEKDSPLGANQMLDFFDDVLSTISDRVTKIGAVQNRLDSAISALDVQSENLTSSLSTLRDADIAEESSNFIKAQILQQASATLLATANQIPSIALNLI